MNLSSLIAPGAAILPFTAVLALCVFLLAQRVFVQGVVVTGVEK